MNKFLALIAFVLAVAALAWLFVAYPPRMIDAIAFGIVSIAFGSIHWPED